MIKKVICDVIPPNENISAANSSKVGNSHFCNQRQHKNNKTLRDNDDDIVSLFIKKYDFLFPVFGVIIPAGPPQKFQMSSTLPRPQTKLFVLSDHVSSAL
ncbi:hypothetical protein CEXT_511131 [Caerostris extrusa]|uniref:Uncharacterized protein n=1 Tax=Caerostris extrusa TaxID=172846 RepID=A0AAV4YFG3_CAEEX|nr:hypothetical protein CEXT_511131 [Caerostris extrusa]